MQHWEHLFCELWLKETERKAAGRNRETAARYCSLNKQKTVYLKVLFQKVFKITTKSSPASLTATVYGAADLPPGIFHSVGNSMRRKSQTWRITLGRTFERIL